MDIMVAAKLKMSQWYVFIANKSSGIVVYIKSMTSRSGEVVILLSTVKYCASPVSFEVPQMKRTVFKNRERMQQRTIQVI